MSDLVGTPAQVALRMETCEEIILDLIKAGRIPHVRLGVKKVVVPWHALDLWLADEATRSIDIPAELVDLARKRLDA